MMLSLPIKERNTFSTFRRNSGQVKMGGEETGKDKNWNTYRYFFYNWNFNCIPHKLFDPNCLDQYKKLEIIKPVLHIKPECTSWSVYFCYSCCPQVFRYDQYVRIFSPLPDCKCPAGRVSCYFGCIALDVWVWNKS